MTSAGRLVKPQAIRSLWPMTTPGSPAKVNPATSNGQAAESTRQCRPIWYQMPGMDGSRCGSLASSGLPVVVCAPDTTHEFEPMPSPSPSRAGTAASAVVAALSAVFSGVTYAAGRTRAAVRETVLVVVPDAFAARSASDRIGALSRSSYGG